MTTATILSNPKPMFDHKIDFKLEKETDVITFFYYNYVNLTTKSDMKTVFIQAPVIDKDLKAQKPITEVKFTYNSVGNSRVENLVINITNERLNKISIEGNISDVVIKYHMLPTVIEFNCLTVTKPKITFEPKKTPSQVLIIFSTSDKQEEIRLDFEKDILKPDRQTKIRIL